MPSLYTPSATAPSSYRPKRADPAAVFARRAYGVFCYLAFIAATDWLMFFLTDTVVPVTVDRGPAAAWPVAVAIDVALIAAFGGAHSLMARERAKRVIRKIVPASLERSTYVLQSSLLLGLLAWQWRPLPSVVWSFYGQAALAFNIVLTIGAGLAIWSSFLIDHLELFGLRQSWSGRDEEAARRFATPALYRIVRHPLQLGILIIFFAAPVMTAGHLMLAVAMAVYIVIGTHLEERALLVRFPAYAFYRRRVPMLIPWRWGARR